MSKYENLFKPIQIGNMEVPNRIVHVPTDISSANADGSISNNVIRYHEEIAKGGTGLIITGASTPDSETGRPTVTCINVDSDYFIPGLHKLATAMQKHGAKAVVQIQHPGRQAAYYKDEPISCNDMIVEIPGSAGHEVVYEGSEAQGKYVRGMTVEEIFDLIEKFGDAAWRVKQAGFDAVELHGAHGYLIAQFMSAYTNKRNDMFGGSLKDRMRFPLEIVKSIQHKCGPDFPILVRYSGEEYMPNSRELPESVEVAKMFEEAGVAALDISAGIFEAAGPTMDPCYYNEGWNTYTADAIKDAVDIPVITSHSLRNPDYCDKIIGEGKTDMVGLSRQMVADPYWANKAQAGKDEDIRKCTSCLIGCWGESLMIKREMKCAVNPTVGHYDDFLDMEPTDNPQKVAVVGGGVGGMEAARIATLKGHEVTIYEKDNELGGILRTCCMVPAKQRMKDYLFWIRKQLDKLGVEVNLRTEATPEMLEEYDVVLAATGGKTVMPDIPGIENAVNYKDVLIPCVVKNCEYYPEDRGDPHKTGDKVIVWGEHFAATDTAEAMAIRGKEVIMVSEESHNGLFAHVEPIHEEVQMMRFEGGNGQGLNSEPIDIPVKIKTNTTIKEIKDNGDVVLQDDEFNVEVIENVDDVLVAKTEPDTSVYESLKEAGLKAKLIGDAKEIGNVRAAVTQGAYAGLNVEESDDLMYNANGELVNKTLNIDAEGVNNI